MRARASKEGLTLRVIAGTNNILLAMDMTDALRAGCLGFTIERTDIETGDRRWLPNLLRFPSDPDNTAVTTARAPLQKFRWGDYTVEPGKRYAYRVIARTGPVAQIIASGRDAEQRNLFDSIEGGVSVEIKTEDNRLPSDTAVYFNRGAAASEAYVRRFGSNDPGKIPAALTWLSRGLEEALIAFIGSAENSEFALHAAIYEFQKPELLKALKAAQARGVDVKVAYHGRLKMIHGVPDPADHTAPRNNAAIAALGIDFAKPRKADPQDAIMHNKFVVLLQKDKNGVMNPIAVWTGSTNWTEGAIYGQLNVGHAVDDPGLAGKYEQYFQMLFADKSAPDMKAGTIAVTPVPGDPKSIAHGMTPIFSPQASEAMIDLYAAICKNAKLLLVSAPFLLHKKIRDVIEGPTDGAVRFMMADKEGSFGTKGSMQLMQRDPGNMAAVATILDKPLNDFQGKLLEHAESFHHAGVHVHSKIIAADPFSSDPILVTGSANFSTNSTQVNDSNSLIVRGDTATTDVYATEFMRMFEHYWFRSHQPAPGAAPGAADTLSLKESANWSDDYFASGNSKMLDRQAFAGLTI